MSKPIILVTSCFNDRMNGRQLAAEQTWFRTWCSLIDIRFVYSWPRGLPRAHELLVDTPDTYAGVPFKNQAAREWALVQKYDYIFHACVDTWINVPRLLASGFEQHDYTGYRCDEGHASGGMGYWISEKAAKVLTSTTPSGAYEDLWVGATLAAAGIPLHEDRRYSSPQNPNRPNAEITFHLSKHPNAEYDAQWMRDTHADWMETGHV